MRILVPVDGSAPANRAVANATTLAAGRDDAMITLVNVQGPETLEVSDVSAVMSRRADRQLARRLGVDQIVIGSRGLGAIGKLVLGSVATKVAHLARVPVTLVK
jgi:nucleotide-binding universal stress UspA family protein